MVFFLYRHEWQAHMEFAHSKDWMRKVHSIVWYCDIDHDSLETFEDESQWRKHMQDLENHPKRKPVPTQAELDALSPKRRKVALRDELGCPLCEQIPHKLRPPVEKGEGDPMDMHRFMVKHVADHMRSLSFEILSILRKIDITGETYDLALIFAHLSKAEATAQEIASNGFDADSKDDYGRTQLSIAAETSDIVTPQLLPDLGAHLNIAHRGGVTPLLLAAEFGNEAMVRLLLDNGARIEAADDHDQTSLSRAASKGHLAVVELLLDRGADVNATDKIYGRTSLSCAASQGHLAVTELLLNQGADIDAADKSRQTPLFWAGSRGHGAIVQLLWQHGADPKLCEPEHGRSLLRSAAVRRHFHVVKLLLDHGANIDAAEDGKTSLSWVAQCGNHAMVRLLLSRGADMEAVDEKSKRTALSFAAEHGMERVVEVLLKHGADIEATDMQGCTALAWAIKNSHYVVATMLRLRGAKSGSGRVLPPSLMLRHLYQ